MGRVLPGERNSVSDFKAVFPNGPSHAVLDDTVLQNSERKSGVLPFKLQLPVFPQVPKDTQVPVAALRACTGPGRSLCPWRALNHSLTLTCQEHHPAWGPRVVRQIAGQGGGQHIPPVSKAGLGQASPSSGQVVWPASLVPYRR